jgi:hypothetical protein
MVTGPVDPAWIEETARKDQFNQDEFERAYRLAHLLGEIAEHPWLSERLVLKGGYGDQLLPHGPGPTERGP